VLIYVPGEEQPIDAGGAVKPFSPRISAPMIKATRTRGRVARQNEGAPAEARNGTLLDPRAAELEAGRKVTGSKRKAR
jgi:hypothetical protein